MIRILAIDLDGTLLNSNKTVSEENKRVLMKKDKQGVNIILSSGKPYSYVRSVAHDIGLNSNGFCISSNGAYIHKLSSDKPYKEFTINKENYREIFNFFNTFDVGVYALTESLIHSPTSIISNGAIQESYSTKINIHSFPIAELDSTSKISKVCLFGDSDYLDSLKGKIPMGLHEKYNIMRSDINFIDIISKKSSKGHALSLLAEELRLGTHEVMCIGDNENDISMMSISGVGVAMGNASDELKLVADFITTSNDEDGVAKAILDYS